MTKIFYWPDGKRWWWYGIDQDEMALLPNVGLTAGPIYLRVSGGPLRMRLDWEEDSVPREGPPGEPNRFTSSGSWEVAGEGWVRLWRPWPAMDVLVGGEYGQQWLDFRWTVDKGPFEVEPPPLVVTTRGIEETYSITGVARRIGVAGWARYRHGPWRIGFRPTWNWYRLDWKYRDNRGGVQPWGFSEDLEISDGPFVWKGFRLGWIGTLEFVGRGFSVDFLLRPGGDPTVVSLGVRFRVV